MSAHCARVHDGRGAYNCSECGRHFLKQAKLTHHWNYAHAQSETKLPCEHCEKTFANKLQLQHHERVCHSGKEHVCSTCKKVFKYIASLKRHEMGHKSEFFYTCDVCGKRIRDQHNLKVHLLTHSKVKPFVCSERDCDTGYTTKQCLQIHYRKVHGYSDSNMPTINRSVPNTMEAHSHRTTEKPNKKSTKTQRKNPETNYFSDNESYSYNGDQFSSLEKHSTPSFSSPRDMSHYVNLGAQNADVRSGFNYMHPMQRSLDRTQLDFESSIYHKSTDVTSMNAQIPTDLRMYPEGRSHANFHCDGHVPHGLTMYPPISERNVDIAVPLFTGSLAHMNSHGSSISANGFLLKDI